MTLEEARKILGLSPDEDPALHIKAFVGARDQIAGLIQNAPNAVIAERYRAGLLEFEAALEAVRLHLAMEGAVANEASEAVVPSHATHPEIEVRDQDEASEEAKPAAMKPVESLSPTVRIPATTRFEDTSSSVRRRPHRILWMLLVLLTLIMAIGWIALLVEKQKRVGYRKEVEDLRIQGMAFVESRRWQEARQVYERMEMLQINSEAARKLRQAVADGEENERRQFFQYWTGEAQTNLEANRLDSAEAAVGQLFTKFPDHPEGRELLSRIRDAREMEALNTALQEGRTALEKKDWDAAIEIGGTILATHPDSAEAAHILEEGRDRKDEEARKRIEAHHLYQQAVARDKGVYDAEALEWAREAALLDPANEAIKDLWEKLSSYTRTLRVPDEFATLEEALSQAHDRDRIVIAEGLWYGPVAINVAVELQGAGTDKTTFSCDGKTGAVMSFGPAAKGARVTGVSFRHETPDFENERYSTVMVRGGVVTFANCDFLDAAGHGLAVIEGGEVEVSHSRFDGNGWDGVNASGPNTVLRVSDCEAEGNFEHGIELWNGAAGVLKSNRCERNSRNGIHVDSGAGTVKVEDNLLRENREFGLVLTSGGSGEVAGNTVSGNLIGGMAIRAAAKAIEIRNNRIRCSDSPGISLEKGMLRDAYLDNEISPMGEAVPLLEGLDFEAGTDGK